MTGTGPGPPDRPGRREPAGLVAYRHAAYDTPWRAVPSGRAARFHRALDEPTQYLCLHPLGPAAELLRHQVGYEGRHEVDTVILDLWAVLVDTDVVTVDFDTCDLYGISPEELVGDDYEPTRRLADRLRGGEQAGFRVPSAALPGTENLVLFGPRVSHPYLAEPTTPEECPTGHLTDAARPPSEVVPLVRWVGRPHRSLAEWRASGAWSRLDDPLAARW